MHKNRHLFGFIVIAVAVLLVTSATPIFARQASVAKLPTPCTITLPDIFLVINGTRHRVKDWDTFLNLGYKQSDIMPCGNASSDPEGAVITRLFKDSTDPVYWMENGLRRLVPDMDTLSYELGSLGLQASDISVFPDAILALWPLGTPLNSVIVTPKVVQSLMLGNFKIKVWHSGALTNFATISAPNQPDIKIEDVSGIGQLPKSDITGEGHPDVMFLISFPGSHCCSGTAIYDLGSVARPVLQIESSGDDHIGLTIGGLAVGNGFGKFKNIASDGHYEFVTADPLTGIPCSQVGVPTVLKYDPAQGRFVGASPQFTSFYAGWLAQLKASAAKSKGTFCEAVPLVSTLLYIGKVADAQTAFNQLYHGSDAQTLWGQLQQAITRGRFYAPAS